MGALAELQAKHTVSKAVSLGKTPTQGLSRWWTPQGAQAHQAKQISTLTKKPAIDLRKPQRDGEFYDPAKHANIRGRTASGRAVVRKAFASHDANSFRAPVATTMRGVSPSFKSSVVHAEGKSTGGKSRGVGRRLSHDANSYKRPVATTMRARTESGRFASGDSALKVFHPIGRKNGRTNGPSNKIERYTNSGATIGHGTKNGPQSGTVRKGLSLPGQGRVGRRL